MLIVISTAKTLDYETPSIYKKYTTPDFLDDSAELVKQLQKMKPDEIVTLMHISPKLATLNSNRYHDWALPFSLNNAKQSILAFRGDVYSGLDADSLSKAEMNFTQKHLRIISGLYGVLRPLDLMQAYHLEIGTKIKNNRGGNLYEFWGNIITEAINKELKKLKGKTLINLASNEYFKSINKKQLKAGIITPAFKDEKNGEYKTTGFFAKKARGLMCRYIIQNKLTNPENVKDFNLEGYKYSKKLSNGENWVFIRDKPLNG